MPTLNLSPAAYKRKLSRQLKWIKEKKKKGLCVNCGTRKLAKKTKRGEGGSKRLCDRCLKAERKRDQKRYKKLITGSKNGIVEKSRKGKGVCSKSPKATKRSGSSTKRPGKAATAARSTKTSSSTS